MTQARLVQYMYALDEIAPKYKTITAAVELIYTVSPEAVDDDIVLCKMFNAHFQHIFTKNSTIERCGRHLRASELKRPVHFRRFGRQNVLVAENKAQQEAHRRYWGSA